MYLGRKAMPSVNPLVSRRQYQRGMDINRKKLRTIKASVDNRAPKSIARGRRRNLKKEQMMEGKKDMWRQRTTTDSIDTVRPSFFVD